MSMQPALAIAVDELANSRPQAGEFESLYRAHVGPITAFFARRTSDPQTVADLTADTFVAAISSFRSSPPRAEAQRAWIFTIARRTYAKHCDQSSRRSDAARRASSRRELGEEEIEELLERIDAERLAHELLRYLARLPSNDREAVELVDIVGLGPREAAHVLGVSAGALRVRLFRARARLRRERSDVQIRG